MVKIAPSILSADFSCLREEIEQVEKAGADLLHIDVMDGHFVPNLTLGPMVVESIRPFTSLPLDVHLMVEEPDRYLEAFAKSGADWISVHQETCPHLHRTIVRIKELGKKAGVVINPATPVSTIEPVLPFVDFVLFMTVNPGFVGQSFLPFVLEKIKRLRQIMEEKQLKNIEIEVDGGINAQTAKQAVECGATILVAGSAIFDELDREAAIRSIRQAVIK